MVLSKKGPTETVAGRISEKLAYTLLFGIGIALTWTANIFEIISYASRAFAPYYAIQASLAAVRAWRSGYTLRTAAFATVALMSAAVVLFGTPVE
ncbi:MAG: hypothetical protein ACE37E_16605 [Hyphomicrobiales bacterium]